MQDRRHIVITPGTSIFRSGVTQGVAPVATLFNPTDVIAGMQDLRLTLRRLRFSLAIVPTITGAGLVANDVIILYAGVTLATAGELANPAIDTGTGQRDDWLWLGQFPMVFGGASPQSFFSLTAGIERNIENQTGLIDIKAQRKLEQDELISLYLVVNNDASIGATVNVPTAAVVSGEVTTSVVYERTMRR